MYGTGKITVRVALNMDRLPVFFFFLYFNEFVLCYVLHFTFYIFRLPLTPGETVWLQSRTALRLSHPGNHVEYVAIMFANP